MLITKDAVPTSYLVKLFKSMSARGQAKMEMLIKYKSDPRLVLFWLCCERQYSILRTTERGINIIRLISTSACHDS